MSIKTVTHTVTIVPHTCGKCGIVFGMESGFMRDRKDDHETWYCPNGHPRAFIGKSEAERAREETERMRLRAEQYRNWWQREQREHESTELSRRAYKGHVTKIKRRVGKGVCPCCNRTFQNLASHMQKKHPDFSEAG